MSQHLDNTSKLNSSSQPDPFMGSHMTYEQINRYGLHLGYEGYIKLIREKRNSLLSQTDWIMRLETKISEEEKELWKTYRQALRDVPQEFSITNTVTWPVIPNVERLWYPQK
jgi:hypothetical protein